MIKSIIYIGLGFASGYYLFGRQKKEPKIEVSDLFLSENPYTVKTHLLNHYPDQKIVNVWLFNNSTGLDVPNSKKSLIIDPDESAEYVFQTAVKPNANWIFMMADISEQSIEFEIE